MSKYTVEKTKTGKFAYPFEMAANTATMAVFTTDDKVLIAKRGKDVDAFPSFWSLPGGFLNTGEETIETTALRELKEELNLKQEEDSLHLFHVSSKPFTDPRYKQVVNVCYLLIISPEEAAGLQAQDDLEKGGLLFLNLDDTAHYIDKMAFDHSSILQKAIKEYKIIKQNNLTKAKNTL